MSRRLLFFLTWLLPPLGALAGACGPAGWAQLGLAAGFTAMGLAWLALAWVVWIPAYRCGIVVNHWSGAYLGLRPPGINIVFRPVERLAESVSTLPDWVTGMSGGIRSADGIPFEVEWQLEYQLDPAIVPAAQRPATLNYMLNNRRTYLALHVENSLRRQLGRVPANELRALPAGQAWPASVENQLRRQLHSLGFEVHELRVGRVDPPQEYQRSLILAQTRPLEAQAEAQALETLHDRTLDWKPADRQWATELEQARAMAQNGVSVVYPFNIPRRPAVEPQPQPQPHDPFTVSYSSQESDF